MHDSLDPKRLTCLPPARLLTLATLLTGVLVAGCGGSSHGPTAAAGSSAARPTTTVATGPASTTTVVTGTAPSGAASSGAALYCGQDPCYAPQQFRVAYGIQPLLDRGIDGRGETVTVLVPVPVASDGPTDIRQDLRELRQHVPAACRADRGRDQPRRLSLAVAGDGARRSTTPRSCTRSPPPPRCGWSCFPRPGSQSAANATADMLAGLRLVVSHTDVASISWSLGEHYFTKAQVAEMHSILLGAEAHHVTVIGSSGDGGSFPTPRGWGGRSRRSAFRPPTRSCWALAAPHSARIARPASTAARPPGPIRVAVSATCMPVPPIRMASPGSQRRGACPTWPVTLMRPAAWRESSPTVAWEASNRSAGTSDSAPLWGGLVALADQYAHHDLGPVNPTIYRHRPQLQLPQGISRRYDRFQRLPGRSRMGPGNGLGNPQRAGAHPAAGPPHQPKQHIAGSWSQPGASNATHGRTVSAASSSPETDVRRPRPGLI